MLAAECVLGILRAEHTVVRHAVRAMSAMTHGRQWRRPGPRLDALDGHVQFLRMFNRQCHGPKDKHLWHPLWGRSEAVNRLLGVLECAHERNADALQHARSVLRAMACGDEALGADLVLTLRRHRVSVERQMDMEEGELVPLARRLLGHEEWAAIASSISAVPGLDRLGGFETPKPASPRAGFVLPRTVLAGPAMGALT